MKKWTLVKIKKELKALKELGWIKSSRKHNTGIGKTLEDHLKMSLVRTVLARYFKPL